MWKPKPLGQKTREPRVPRTPHRDSLVMLGVLVMLAVAAEAHAQPSLDPSRDEGAVEEIGPSPVYYRLPEIPPTLSLRGGPSLSIDVLQGATAFGFRLGVGAALAMARDPHHVLAIEAGYAYRGFDDHLGSAGVTYMFSDADVASDVNAQPGLSVSVAAIGGGRASDLGAGIRVALAFRFFYALEVAYEWLSTRNGALEHVVVLTIGGSGAAW